MSQVYVVIVNYTNWQDTADCLQSLFCSAHQNFKVFVVDNASGNDSLEKLKHQFAVNQNLLSDSFVHLTDKEFEKTRDVDRLPPLVLIQLDRNDGFAGGNNVVLEKLRTKEGYVWLLNPDMTFPLIFL